MHKILMMNPEDLENIMMQRANNIFENVVEITKKHGVCFIRFTKEDGMVIINPEYNSRINGAIADA